MRGLLRPVGDQPTDVYWRRRATLFVAVVVVTAIGWLVVQAIASRGDDAAAAAPGPDVTVAAAATSPSPTARVMEQSPAPTGACAASDLSLTISPDPFTVAADATPAFAVEIEHVGPVPCVVSADGEDTALLITSGQERIWFSGDCPAESALIDGSWLLEPGSTKSVEVAWPRIRSGEGCATVDGGPAPGYYWAELTVQGVTAEAVQFQLS